MQRQRLQATSTVSILYCSCANIRHARQHVDVFVSVVATVDHVVYGKYFTTAVSLIQFLNVVSLRIAPPSQLTSA